MARAETRTEFPFQIRILDFIDPCAQVEIHLGRSPTPTETRKLRQTIRDWEARHEDVYIGEDRIAYSPRLKMLDFYLDATKIEELNDDGGNPGAVLSDLLEKLAMFPVYEVAIVPYPDDSDQDNDY